LLLCVDRGHLRSDLPRRPAGKSRTARLARTFGPMTRRASIPALAPGQLAHCSICCAKARFTLLWPSACRWQMHVTRTNYWRARHPKERSCSCH